MCVHLIEPSHPGEGSIKELFIDDKLTQTELAKHLNVSQSTLNRLLNGKSSVSCEMALRLEKVLGIDAIQWLNMQYNYNLSRLRTIKSCKN